MIVNLYSVLLISSHATKEEIKNAYYMRKMTVKDRNTLWLIEEAYTVLMDDHKRIKYDALIFKHELSQRHDIVSKSADSSKAIDLDKTPKLLLFIVWLFSFECGSILFKLIIGTVKFAMAVSHNPINNSLILVSTLGIFVTLIPVVISILAVYTRYKIAIAALITVAFLHLIRNVISFFMLGIVVDSVQLIVLPALGILLLIIAMFNKDVKVWLNKSITDKKGYLFVFLTCGIVYMVIFANGLLDMKSRVSQQVLLDETQMKFLGADDYYYYYIDLSRRVTPITNGYAVPIIVTTTNKQSHYQTDIIIDSKMKTFCMVTANTNCNNQNEFSAYSPDSPASEAVQFLENGHH